MMRNFFSQGPQADLTPVTQAGSASPLKIGIDFRVACSATCATFDFCESSLGALPAQDGRLKNAVLFDHPSARAVTSAHFEPDESRTWLHATKQGCRQSVSAYAPIGIVRPLPLGPPNIFPPALN